MAHPVYPQLGMGCSVAANDKAVLPTQFISLAAVAKAALSSCSFTCSYSGDRLACITCAMVAPPSRVRQSAMCAVAAAGPIYRSPQTFQKLNKNI
jgi:hypothetical protein